MLSKAYVPLLLDSLNFIDGDSTPLTRSPGEGQGASVYYNIYTNLESQFLSVLPSMFPVPTTLRDYCKYFVVTSTGSTQLVQVGMCTSDQT